MPTERFPYGRIVVGNTLPRSGMELLSAQSLQTDNGDLVVLDVAWLEVGHVDEVMAVVPSPTGKFKILLADVRLAADLIAQDENIEAYGPDMSAILMPYKDAANQAKINAVQSHLNGIRRTLLESLDIEANDIVSIPVLFSIPSSIEDENLRVMARLPNSVNLVSVPTEDGNLRIAIPDPFYIPFTDYLENVLFQLGIDDKIVPVTTMGPHEHGGEAHCASIVVRKRIP